MSEEQKQQLMAIRLQDGTTALDYVLSWPEAEREWSIAGVLSCIEKGYSLNHLTINWEARDIIYEQQKNKKMKQDTYDQADELARLQAENDQLKAQMAELTAQQERKDVRIPQERKRKLPTTNADSKGQLTGESYLNSRREHWRKEIERDPVLRKNKEQTRLRREQEKEQEEQKEQELSLWHWRAVGICVALVVLFFIIAFLAGKYHFDFMYALLPMVPTIGVIIWGDQMRETLEAGKDPWIELIKMILFSAIALVLLYFSFIFIIAVLILLKFLKSK